MTTASPSESGTTPPDDLDATNVGSHHHLVRVLDEVDDVVLVARLGHGLVYANRAALAYFPNLRFGALLSDLMPPELRQLVDVEIRPAIERLERWTGDLDVHRPDGTTHVITAAISPVFNHDHDAVYFGVILRNVTTERQHAAELAALARCDPLTGLPNRLALMELLEGPHDGDVTVAFIDLDDLKVVNDGLGHSAGDRLLVEVARALEAAAGGAIVTRFGGDEFVVVHHHLGDLDRARRTAEGLLDTVRSVVVPEVPTTVSASIGVAWAPADEIDAESLVKDADTAMYDAKRRGRGRVSVFDRVQREQVTRRFVMESALRSAIDADQIEVHLQPVVSLVDGTIAGFEALARWGLASPAEFVATAEASGLIVPMGRWILDTTLAAVSDLDRHLSQLGPSAPVDTGSYAIGVNVSGRELLEPSYAPHTIATIDRHGISPRRVVLELTESVLIDPSEEVDRTLRSLRDAGITLALDDFGTGYSSLGHLRRYPVDALKLDNSYTASLLGDSDTRVIAETIVTMAQRLGLMVVAEGVETEAQRQAVTDLGIEWAQGYLLSPALPVQELIYGSLQSIAARLYRPEPT